MNRRIISAVLLSAAAWGACENRAAAHTAYIACADGNIEAGASLYNGGQYRIDGGPWITFGTSFAVTIDGAARHTIEVRADDWPTYRGAAGPCRHTPTTTVPATTTTETPPSTSTPTTPSTTTAQTTPSSSTSPTAPTTSTTAIAPPPSEPSVPPSTPNSVTPNPPHFEQPPENCTQGCTPPSSTSSSPSPRTTPTTSTPQGPSETQPSPSSTPSLPATGPDDPGFLAAIAALTLLTGFALVAIARKRQAS